MADIFPRIILKNHKPIDGRCSTNPKQKKSEKLYQGIA